MRPNLVLRSVTLWVGGLLLPWATVCVAARQINTESLIQNLSDADPAVRGEALRGLESLPTQVVVRKSIEALRTADRDVAKRLVNVLTKHPDSTEVEPLIELAKKYDGLGTEVFAGLGPAGARGLMSATVRNCDAKVGNASFLT
jgi:hypothetical protein